MNSGDGKEIERKYLVRGDNDDWREGTPGKRIRQGYLNKDPALTVRVRVYGDDAFLTVKGPTVEASRSEWEDAIPLSAAETIIDEAALPPVLEKTRYRREVAEYVFEIDEFHGHLEGLITAEVEKPAAEPTDDGARWQPKVQPAWLGQDVTGYRRYLNSRLPDTAYAQWPADERTRSDGTVPEPGERVEP